MNTKRMFVSGLMNVETNVKIKGFPIPYYPIDYPFFGIHSNISGVGVNVAGALKTLHNEVYIMSMIGEDDNGARILAYLKKKGYPTELVATVLKETPVSVNLYEESGKRQIYCDLKDIQETPYPMNEAAFGEMIANFDLAIMCNTNFNRPFLKVAKEKKIPIATDVHVLSRVDDDYNRDFLQYADLLFLSDEGLSCDEVSFIRQIAKVYHNKVIVMGRGERGAMLYTENENCIYALDAVKPERIINTAGAGDALFSSFLYFYSMGITPLEALWKAQVFASHKIGVNGASEGFLEPEDIEWLYDAKKETFITNIIR